LAKASAEFWTLAMKEGKERKRKISINKDQLIWFLRNHQVKFS
jgi:hypothetical protein